MIFWIASVLTLIYGCTLLLLLLLWYSKRFPVLFPEGHTDVFASILIPVRNESKSIRRLVYSIEKGKSKDYEIIVIDDHSDDDTVAMVKSLQQEFDNLSLARLGEHEQGKKAAISYGVKVAKGDLIICTDGDSAVSPDWMNEHKKAYSIGLKLAFGPVKFFNENKSRWIDMLNLELAALVGMGAVTLKLGKPGMINGCNYSFSKVTFNEVGGFEGNKDVPTGDDEFLLRKVHEKYPFKIRFLQSTKALVSSEPPESFGEFYHQRRRWASKWKLHKDAFSVILPVSIFAIYVVWGWLAIEAMLSRNVLGFYILSAKFVVDFFFVRSFSKIQQSNVSLISFVLLQIIYPVYVVFFGLASNFGKYNWRGRVHKI